MITKPIFWDYITTDEDGEMTGIKKDAPLEVKNEYEKYLKEEEIKRKKMIK